MFSFVSNLIPDKNVDMFGRSMQLLFCWYLLSFSLVSFVRQLMQIMLDCSYFSLPLTVLWIEMDSTLIGRVVLAKSHELMHPSSFTFTHFLHTLDCAVLRST